MWERLEREGSVPLDLPDGLRFADGFPTPSGRCRLWDADWAPPSANGFPLVMVSAKYGLHFLNSSYAHLPRHAAAEGEMRVDMHADDAGARGISDGSRVRVFNQRGALELIATVGEGVRPGVVAIPHGYWGRSANALTSDGLSDAGGGGDFYGTRVEVELA
jgi:anaerobic selenocysteine-containing dehydrogenase